VPAALAPASRAAAPGFGALPAALASSLALAVAVSIALSGALALAPRPAAAAPAIRQSAAAPPTALRSELILDRATLESWGIAHPARLAFDAEGALYVLDTSRRRLVKVGADGRLIHEVALSGDDPSSSTEPGDVVVDARGSVLVLDRAGASVLAYDKNGALLAARPFAPDLADEARDPRTSLLLDAFGRLWLLAPRERDLVRLDASLAPDRAGRFLTPEDSVGTPGAAAAAPNGEAWIADRLSGALHRYRASGALAGTARFDSTAAVVAALAADGSGYVYAADARGERILVFGSDGARVLERAVGGPSRRWNPSALAWSPRDRLAAADPDDGEVQIFAIERGSP
jgi:sugar lactone lactonase YvrE